MPASIETNANGTLPASAFEFGQVFAITGDTDLEAIWPGSKQAETAIGEIALA